MTASAPDVRATPAERSALDRLVRTNWIRTAAWSGHGALALWMLAVGA